MGKETKKDIHKMKTVLKPKKNPNSIAKKEKPKTEKKEKKK